MSRYEEWQREESRLARQDERDFYNRHNGYLTAKEPMVKIICDRCDCENSEVANIRNVGLSWAPITSSQHKSDYCYDIKRDLCKSCYSDILAFLGNKP